MTISDATERERALDPSQSFVVQAPAGSGKTSLLVQRYLKLLSIVNVPEEILAITFTKKAAFSMRSRVIAALKQNQFEKWDLIQNPHRLRIQTIDSFCHFLVNRTPILTQIDTNAQIVQNQEADLYYSKAAEAALKNITDPQYSTHLERLLLHLDNDWQRAKDLFISMLKSREQWLPHIVGLKNIKALRQNMELALQEISSENIELCLATFPSELYQELIPLLKFAENNREATPPSSDLGHWLNMANLLLTKEFSWRKKITKEQGFPAPTTPGISKEEKELFKTMKVGIEELLAKLSEQENLRTHLENLVLSPKPNYSDEQWSLIESLLELLPLLAAELKLTFRDATVTDHAEISMSAYSALGDQESPSDIALNLDYRLQHLLIDEFQDTSISQYRLIEKLITTWQPDDSRTIFIVGDPMQSIYRFREAEVGLFLRVQHEGIGNLKPLTLTLNSNFRSSQTIIKWINNNFAKILPQIPDISFGAIPFESSVAVTDDPNSTIEINLYQDGDDSIEAAHITTTIQKILATTTDSTIAILVKSRSHLPKILAALRVVNLHYQAIELETLNENMIIRDLVILTRALYDLTDRIAWIAMLRAPWCGIDLTDLHKVANGEAELIWDNICQHQILNLSDDGKTRLLKFQSNLTPFLNHRERLAWSELIEKAWLALGGPATTSNEEELAYTETYFELLKNTKNNHLDIITLQKKLDSLYTPPTPDAKIQVMTIHKAKGLEFDHVIIPGINRATRSDAHQLMLWLERPKLHQGSSLLLAPIKASGKDSDHVYQYLRVVEQKKGFYETGRLLYVAMTRAKKSIYISGYIKSSAENNITKNIQAGSLLEQLKSCFDNSWITKSIATAVSPLIKIEPPIISRLTKDWQSPVTISLPPSNNPPTWQLTYDQAAIIGTVIHHVLRQISEDNIDNWTTAYIDKQLPYWRKLLRQEGYIDLNIGLKLIDQAVQTTLSDEQGRWILTKHKGATSELAITTNVNNKYKNYIIDRTFIDESGIRWIIDYKTSQPNGENIEDFLLQEQAKYTPQLSQYAGAIKALYPKETIKLALYFPLCRGWIEIHDYS